MSKQVVKNLLPPQDLPEWIEEYFLIFCRVTSLGYMSSSIMHEIGNAMTVISGNAQIMQIKKEAIEKDDIFKRIDLIMSQTDRIQAAIHKVGSFGGRTSGAITKMSPGRAVDNSLYAFEHRNDISNLSVEKEIMAEHGNVAVDPSVLEYIILELLSMFIFKTNVNGKLFIYSGSDENNWRLSADYSPSVDSSKVFESWESI